MHPGLRLHKSQRGTRPLGWLLGGGFSLEFLCALIINPAESCEKTVTFGAKTQNNVLAGVSAVIRVAASWPMR